MSAHLIPLVRGASPLSPKILRGLERMVASSQHPRRMNERAARDKSIKHLANLIRFEAGLQSKPVIKLSDAHQLMKPGGALRVFEKVRTEVLAVETRRADELYAEVAQLCDLAVLFRTHEPSWAEFCARDWSQNDTRKRPKLNEPHNASRFLAIALFEDVKEPAKRNRLTSRYLAVLSELLAREVAPDAVEGVLRASGGINGLETAWRKRQRQLRSSAGLPDKSHPMPKEQVKAAESAPVPSPKTKSPSRNLQIPRSNEGEGRRPTGSAKPSAKCQNRHVLLRMNRSARRVLAGREDANATFSVSAVGQKGDRPILKIVRKS